MLAYQTDPQAVSVLNGAQVITAAKNMSVSMVVENVGNQIEHNVTITALLALADGTQQSLRDFIDLGPVSDAPSRSKACIRRRAVRVRSP